MHEYWQLHEQWIRFWDKTVMAIFYRIQWPTTRQIVDTRSATAESEQWQHRIRFCQWAKRRQQTQHRWAKHTAHSLSNTTPMRQETPTSWIMAERYWPIKQHYRCFLFIQKLFICFVAWEWRTWQRRYPQDWLQGIAPDENPKWRQLHYLTKTGS